VLVVVVVTGVIDAAAARGGWRGRWEVVNGGGG